MFFWIMLIILVITTVASYLLTPRPKTGAPQPSALGDFTLPTAQAGRIVPVIYGTVKLAGGNCTYWGDLQITSLSEHHQIYAYMYRLGIQLALCYGGERGSEVEFISFLADDKVVPITSGIDSNDVLNIWVRAYDFFGGKKQEGGVAGTIMFYNGHPANDPKPQVADAYLARIQGRAVPAYRGICHAVFAGFYVGTSSYVKTLGFILKRCPNPFGYPIGPEIHVPRSRRELPEDREGTSRARSSIKRASSSTGLPSRTSPAGRLTRRSTSSTFPRADSGRSRSRSETRSKLALTSFSPSRSGRACTSVHIPAMAADRFISSGRTAPSSIATAVRWESGAGVTVCRLWRTPRFSTMRGRSFVDWSGAIIKVDFEGVDLGTNSHCFPLGTRCIAADSGSERFPSSTTAGSFTSSRKIRTDSQLCERLERNDLRRDSRRDELPPQDRRR